LRQDNIIRCRQQLAKPAVNALLGCEFGVADPGFISCPRMQASKSGSR
jgi:hypothetical protein